MRANGLLAVVLCSICASRGGAGPITFDIPKEARVVAPPEWVNRALVIGGTWHARHSVEPVVKQIQPDLLDWNSGMSANWEDFVRNHGIRVCGGGLWDREWDSFPTGSPLLERFERNGARLTATGSKIYNPRYGVYMVCHNAPLWHDIQMQGRLQFALICDAVSNDQLCNGGAGYCRWCLARSRDYFKQRYSPKQLANWGIADLDTFDRAALAQARKQHEGLRRAWSRFSRDSAFYWVATTANEIRKAGRRAGREIPFYGNQGCAFGRNVPIVIYSQWLDVVWLEEHQWAVSPDEAGPRRAWNPLSYKVGLATSHLRKPVWINHASTEAQVWEAFANGGVVHLGWGERRTGKEWMTSKRRCAFVDANRALFLNRRPYVQVGLLYSIPDGLARGGGFTSPFAGYSCVLENVHLPFEVVIFGHPHYWDDAEALASLTRFRVLVAPGAQCMTERQARALRGYVRHGGTLVVLGDIATADEDARQLSQSRLVDLAREQETTYGTGRVTCLPMKTMVAFLRAGKRPVEGDADFIALRDAALWAGRGQRLVETDAPALTRISPWLYAGTKRLALHIVNYSRSADGDVIPQPAFKIKVKLPRGLNVQEAFFISPEREKRSRININLRDGFAEINVPEFQVYGVATLGPRGELDCANQIAQAERFLDRIDIALGLGRRPPQKLADGLASARTAYRRGDFAGARKILDPLLQQLRDTYDQVVKGNLDARRGFRESIAARAQNAVRAFDFGAKSAPDGWIPITAASGYAPRLGYGWSDLAGLREHNVQKRAPLFGDFLEGSQRQTFRIDLPDGAYLVSVLTGGLTALREGYYESWANAEVDGEVKLVGFPDRPDRREVHSFVAPARNGHLDVTFSGGRCWSFPTSPKGWRVDGLLVERAAAPRPGPPAMQGALREWRIAGPFPDPDCLGMETEHPVESALLRDVEPRGGKWWLYVGPERGYAPVPLADLFEPNRDAIACALTHVHSPQACKALLWFGSTGRARVWLNRAEAVTDVAAAGLKPDEYRAPVKLRQGWNSLLVKVCQNWGHEWAFAAALTTPDAKPLPGLRCSAAGSDKVTCARIFPSQPPTIQCPKKPIELGREARVVVRFANPTDHAISGKISLRTAPSTKVLPAAEAAFANVAPSRTVEKVFSVMVAGFAEATESLTFHGRAEYDGLYRTSSAQLQVLCARLKLIEGLDPLVVDDMDDCSRWSCPRAYGFKSMSNDTADFKQGQASLRIIRQNDGNGSDNFGIIRRHLVPRQDWSAYEALSVWAKVTSSDPEIRSKSIYVAFFHANTPMYSGPTGRGKHVNVGEWTKLTVDISKFRRDDLKALTFWLYETQLDKHDTYTWHLDDLRLLGDPSLPPIEVAPRDAQVLRPGELLLGLFLTNPLSVPARGQAAFELPKGWSAQVAGGGTIDLPAHSRRVVPVVLEPPEAHTGPKRHQIRAAFLIERGPRLSASQTVVVRNRVLCPLNAPAPKIDGKLDDACWRLAGRAAPFVRNDGSRVAFVQTEALVCADAANLYVAFKCHEPAMSAVVANVVMRDGPVWNDDSVELFLGSAERALGHYKHFIVNPAAALYDAHIQEKDWDANVRVKTSKSSDAWFVEMAIPFSCFDRAPRPGEAWLINFNRGRRAQTRELSCWSCTYGGFHVPHEFGEVIFGK